MTLESQSENVRDIDGISTVPSFDSEIPLVPLRMNSTHTVSMRRQVSNSSLEPLLPSKSASNHPSMRKRRALISSISERFQPLKDRLPKGWRFGATLALVLSSTVLFINIVVASVLFATARRNGKLSATTPILTGSCRDVKHKSVFVHLGINVASTLLLSGSNYCMQCINAPTRRDIDRAHQRGTWLDIGVPSVRNLRFMSPRRLILWISLGISSVPLHLVYNSTFFLSTTHNSFYHLLFASSSFEKGAPVDDMFLGTSRNFTVQDQGLDLVRNQTSDTLLYGEVEDSPRLNVLSIQSAVQLNASQFEYLKPADCITAYVKRILPERSDLILVASNTPYDDSGVFETGFGNSCQNKSVDAIRGTRFDAATCNRNSSLFFARPVWNILNINHGDSISPAHSTGSWICSDNPNCINEYKSLLKGGASNWTVHGFQVEHCLSQRVDNQCSFNVALSLLLVVIIFNAFKVGSIAITLFQLRDKPLITFGDAVESFIIHEDRCSSRRDLSKKGNANSSGPQRTKWWRAASKSRWSVALSLASFALLVILLLLVYSVSQSGIKSGQDIWEMGLGTIDPRTLITGWAIPTRGDGATIASILVANSPQIILSFIYIAFNGIFTKMAMAVEWSRYGLQYRTLRVSEKKGDQRTTYFLQIPYRLGIPVMLFSMVLHWLVSQSIFLAKINDAETGEELATTCGYSPLGMIGTLLAGTSLIVFAVVLGKFKTLHPGAPLVGSSSLAISTACHTPQGTSPLRPLMWRPVPDEMRARQRHGWLLCTFKPSRSSYAEQVSLYLG